jgi:hypothetical protein
MRPNLIDFNKLDNEIMYSSFKENSYYLNILLGILFLLILLSMLYIKRLQKLNKFKINKMDNLLGIVNRANDTLYSEYVKPNNENNYDFSENDDSNWF